MKLNLKLPTNVARQMLKMQKHSPAIMFGAGIAGVVTTTVLACKATLKLDSVLEETKGNMDTARELFAQDREEYTQKDFTQDMTMLRVRAGVKVAKLYAPAIALGIGSIGLLTGSHIVLNKRNIALTAAYTTLEKGFNQYRDRVREEFGADKDQELRYGYEEVEEAVEGKNGTKVKTTKVANPSTGKSIYSRFFDELNRNWQRQPEYNRLFIQCQQNYANDLLRSRGHVFLNEVYDLLGMERSKPGAVVGWVLDKDGDGFIDFGVFTDGSPEARAFVEGREGSILLDFNVDGVIYDKI